MANHISTLQRALKDPKIEGITCICDAEMNRLKKIIPSLPANAIISEWKYGIGQVHYEYHIHTNGNSVQLKEAYEQNVRGGHPKLTALYSIEQLNALIQQYAAASECQRDIS